MRTAFVAMLAFLVGCAAPPPGVYGHSSPAGPAARLDLGRALARHPFAAVLAQYDADIATLQRAAGGPAFANLHSDIEAGIADVNRRLETASTSVRGLHARPIQPPAAGASPRDFGSGVVGAFQEAAQTRVARAVDLRAAQLREREATAAFDFERANAGRRLVLGLKLRNLHLDASTRHRYRAQLAALDRQESALVAAERQRDDGILVAYRAQLRAQTLADSASMAADVANHAHAMHDIPQPPAQAFPRSMLHPEDDVATTLAAFDSTRRDLTAHFSNVRARDDSARSDVRTEISNLERERDALRAQIVSSIEARAAQIAAARHLGRLYTTGAPSGARDITDAVVSSYWVSTGS